MFEHEKNHVLDICEFLHSQYQLKIKAMKATITTFSFILLSLFSFGQWSIDNARSEMTIYGTSNVHDWEEDVETIKGTMSAETSGSVINSVTALRVTIPVKSIKSGKSAMDKNTYNALKADKYANIEFVLKSVRIEGSKIYCTGTLTIAGTTKTISIPVNYTANGSQITVKGSYKMKMTDFKIDPPTAMFGTIYTGDEVELKFNIVLTK